MDSKRENEESKSSELNKDRNYTNSDDFYLKKNDKKICFRFSLARENYEWLQLYCIANSEILISFQDFIESEITQYFCVFCTGKKLSLFRDLHTKKRKLFEKNLIRNKHNKGIFLFLAKPEPNTFVGKTTVSVKVHLYKRCYYWLVAFCHLAQLDFKAFFSREINAYFRGFYSKRVPTFRDAFIELINELDKIPKEEEFC